LQRDAIDAAFAGIEVARSTVADGDVRFDAALDQIALRFADALAVRVDDAHVVEAVRQLARVENRPDVRGIEHLPAFGLAFGYSGTGELDQSTRLEVRAMDVERDPAVLVVAGAALVGGDPADRQRQKVGAQGERVSARRVSGELALPWRARSRM